MKSLAAGIAAAGMAVWVSHTLRNRAAEAMGIYHGEDAVSARITGADLVHPPGLPVIGKWMLDPDLSPAHWLGERYRAKRLREPINVLLLDRVAASEQQARQRLSAAMAAAGYPSREGHSSGYRGYIGTKTYPQLPSKREHAFSNEPFEVNNNHGRVFGPRAGARGFLFIAAFSREHVDPLRKIKHGYASFNQARDHVASKLDEQGAYRLRGFVHLRNSIVNDTAVCTGDHDGMAALLIAEAS
ncbi:hypothetical protein CAI21_09815 [Alkalilimnicola ehrlichii]|uniref:LssY-like C-terminal domain-containing protein n=1 Tax=Alkalilimnicola ehrlichii TaxID=351052 RepID=A0A3E0WV62_9GAMM|nr:hypothetical protein [Alkalilimnicola ehrlichii]RFA29356.1 hypothetical protein CAI21_09815 [Alkalilimnicola ehrlichii]RFA36870.1 hypothetical protein CAL65_10150 [Alkalilimnicola ehrlichii]